ncbi:MAG: AraC family transcriptional regulator [Clostridiales bacterium]|nr:AraC family transcriptional regulator [Clostridiales bacterium]
MNEVQLFQTRQHMLNKKFEVFNYEDITLDNIDFHQHDYFELYLFLSGKVTYIIEGRQYNMLPNDLLIIPIYALHKPIIEESKDQYRRMVLWIDRDYLNSLCSEQTDLEICFDNVSKNENNLIRGMPDVALTIKHLMKELYKYNNDGEFGSDILCRSLIQQLLVYIRRISLYGTANVMDSITETPLVNKAINFINENYTEKLTLEMIAEHCYCSKFYLSRKFKEYTKNTVYNYIMQKRLTLAKRLIYKGKPISDLHFSCGFGDYSNFFRAFKNAYTISPKQYAEIVKEQFSAII